VAQHENLPTSTNSDGPRTESRTRSILKALSWRVVATTTTVLVALFYTGNLNTALSIGGIEFFAKIPVYYLHERGWQMVPSGTIRRLFNGRR